MKYTKSVSLDEDSIKIIESYMRDNKISNFSKSICELIKWTNLYIAETNKWKKIAEKYKDELHKISKKS